MVFGIFIILDLASITASSVNNKEMSWVKLIKNYYKAIRLMNVNEFDDSFEFNTKMNGGYILSTQSYYMKILDVNNVLLITNSTYQIGYTLCIYNKINNEFKEFKMNITECPSPLYWYRYFRLNKLIKSTKCKIVEPDDVNKIINEHYTIYNRDTKLKELLNES